MKNIFAEICKVDDEKRMVYGYASTEAMDVQGEVVTKDAMAAALDDYMQFANIREMHQPSAVGVAKSAEMDEKGCFISAHVVDDSAWAKVKAGVYKGFSIGGKAINKVDGIIKSLRLSEISLVDRPANPEALITVWKADGVPSAAEQEVAALAEMLDKGDVTPARLIELAKADMETKAAADAAKADVAKGYEGEEVWDASTAIDALSRIQYLLEKEREEVEEGADEPEANKQIAALTVAVAALKEFIASEIQENNAEVEMSDKGGDVAKAGKAISAANMSKMQDMHDSLVKLGVNCGTAKHDHADDLAKMSTEKDEAIAKVATLEADITKLNGENAVLKSEVERLKAMPAPGKALLNAIAVSKADDAGMGQGETVNKIAPVVDAKGDVNDAASLIKMIHSKGGVIVR